MVRVKIMAMVLSGLIILMFGLAGCSADTKVDSEVEKLPSEEGLEDFMEDEMNSIDDNTFNGISNDFEGDIKLNTDKEIYSLTDTMILTIINNSEKEISFGRPYTIEQFKDGEWTEYHLDLMFTMELIILDSGKTFEQQVPLDEFETGKFRLTKRIMFDESDINLSIEFEIQ